MFLVIIGYGLRSQTWCFWSYSIKYPGTRPGVIGHTRIPNLVFGHTRVPNLVFLVTLGVPNLVFSVILGCQTWRFWPYSDSKPGVFGHTQICIHTRASPKSAYAIKNTPLQPSIINHQNQPTSTTDTRYAIASARPGHPRRHTL